VAVLEPTVDQLGWIAPLDRGIDEGEDRLGAPALYDSYRAIMVCLSSQVDQEAGSRRRIAHTIDPGTSRMKARVAAAQIRRAEGNFTVGET
jgi:hypothetical protein